MSAYSTGYTVPYTGNQQLWRHRQIIAKEKKIMKHHEQTTNVRCNIKPPLHDARPEQLAQARSVYGVRLRPIPTPLRVYDRIMKLQPDWDPKVTKDEYRNLHQFKNNARLDEDNREIPVMSNCEPGHRLHSPPESFKREHARVMVYHNSVWGTNGVNLGVRKM
ncbi:uncharacterized protein [Littorina saxatilis]|uniref:Uncharacterized protein n=1 Tax=Littorina saxatilis TaxID=31220 RepID=A0AAN9C0K7_9CAEN